MTGTDPRATGGPAPADGPVGVAFRVVDPRSDEAVAAVTAYFEELDERFPDGFHDWDSITADAADFERPTGRFVLMVVDDGADPDSPAVPGGDPAAVLGEVVGCGAVRTLSPGTGEIKRMWVAPSHRGRGLAARLLVELERQVVELGNDLVRLDTNAVLVEAIRMYERSGYTSIERYNDNPDAERWFEKRLG